MTMDVSLVIGGLKGILENLPLRRTGGKAQRGGRQRPSSPHSAPPDPAGYELLRHLHHRRRAPRQVRRCHHGGRHAGGTDARGHGQGAGVVPPWSPGAAVCNNAYADIFQTDFG